MVLLLVLRHQGGMLSGLVVVLESGQLCRVSLFLRLEESH